MKKPMRTMLGLVSLMTLPLLSGAADYTWDVNGAVGGYSLTAYGTSPRAGDWDAASTNWTLTANGDGPLFAWPNSALPAARDNPVFKYRYQNPSPGTLSAPDILVHVVGTRYSGRVSVDYGAYVIWSNGAVNLQTTGTAMQMGNQSSNNTLHIFSDLQIGGDATTASQTLYVGSDFDAKCMRNILVIEGAVYASGPTGAATLTLSTMGYATGEGTKIILRPGSVISNGTSSALDINWGATRARAVKHGRIELYATNTYTGYNYLFGGKTVVYVNSLHGQAGAFGNGTSWLQFSRSQTDPTNTVQLLTGIGGVTIGRSIQLRKGTANNTTYGAILGGEHTNGLSTFSGQLDLTMETYDRTTDVHVVAAEYGTVNFSGNIANGAGGGSTPINKIGLGTVWLSGANSYSGPTKVTEGTLLVNGTTGTGAVTVASAATLGGNGTIRGPVTVQSGAYLAPGTNTIGTLAVSNLTFAADSTYRWEGNSAGGDRVNALVGASLPAAMTVTVTRTDSSKLVGVAVLIDSATPITGGDPAGITILPPNTYYLRLSGDGKQLQLRPNSPGTAVIIL